MAQQAGDNGFGRFELAPNVSNRVCEWTEGTYRVEADPEGASLVRIKTGEAIPLLVASNGHPRRFAELARLSDRERACFDQLGDGHDMSEIAELMGVSIKTVETYRARVKQKLGIKHRGDLLRFAVEWSLVRPRQEHPPLDQRGESEPS